MGKRTHHNRGGKSKSRGSAPPPPPLEVYQKKPPVEYGKPFTLLEDANKATFEFKAGAWVPYPMTIAQCRQNDCEVKELPQKVKFMTRYEVRCPVA